MPALEAPWYVQYGVIGVLTVTFVLLVLRGYLQPRTVVQDLRSDRDTRVAEISEIADTWREAYMTERDARRLHLEAVTRNLEVSELTLDIVRSWDKTLTDLSEGHDGPPTA